MQGGDIVKGGDQDRVLPNDFVVPSKSGKVPIAAFCVEQGRWSQRGAEPAMMFSVSTDNVSNKDMALAAKTKKDQAEVWKQVQTMQESLGLSARADRFAPTSGPRLAGGNGQVRAFASPSSLQLTLESRPVGDAVAEYLSALSAAPGLMPDVVGFAFAVSGKIGSADIYSSAALFQAMWPKLLKSSAVEAVIARAAGQTLPAPPLAAVESLIQGDGPSTTSTVKVGRATVASRIGETARARIA